MPIQFRKPHVPGGCSACQKEGTDTVEMFISASEDSKTGLALRLCRSCLKALVRESNRTLQVFGKMDSPFGR